MATPGGQRSLTRLLGSVLVAVSFSLATAQAGDLVFSDNFEPRESFSLAVLGDSNSDEYRFDDNRGGAFRSVTFNWLELLINNRQVDLGPTGNWGGPRRSGYAYNWARSGATAASLVGAGQHTGVAQQIANGEVTHVIVWIGINDFHPFNGPYEQIYSGALSGAALQAKIDNFVADVEQAVSTVRAAGPEGILLVDLGDPGISPALQLLYPFSILRQRVTDAITEVNEGMARVASQYGAELVRQDDINRRLLDSVNGGFLNVDGVLIDMFQPGDEPTHAILNDTHAGTVFSGLLLNELFVDPLNSRFGLPISPLTDTEILSSAGLR